MASLQTIDDASGDRRLPPPPRTVPPALARYLRWACFNIPLTIIGFTLIAFWGNCGFGADVESLLFLSRITPATGTVTGFEPTGARVSAGTVSPTRHYTAPDTPSVPVYAVYFAYTAPAGRRHTGVCFADGLLNNPSLPAAEAAAPVADFTDASLPALTPGTPVVVETVDRGRFARIRGTRTNLYELHMLIILVFPGFGVFLLLAARRYLRRALPLLATGQEDPAARGIGNPANAARSISLTTFPFNRVRARDGVLQVPPLGMRLKIWITPLLALLCNLWYIADNAKEIFYPIKVMLGYEH